MDAPIYHLEKLLRTKQAEGEDFVGPLDLILHLLSKNKVEISDIPIAQILDQYLEWMAKRQELDLEITSEFIAMASHLLYIKTRMLLSSTDEEVLSEMELLIAKLERRQQEELCARIRSTLPAMEQRYLQASAALTTPLKPFTPEESPRPLAQHQAQALLRAMERALSHSRMRQAPPLSAFRHVVGREPYSVEQKSASLLARLRSQNRLSFSTLLRESESRSELVALFLVVLELCKHGTLFFWEEGEELILVARDRAQEKAVEDDAMDTAACTD